MEKSTLQSIRERSSHRRYLPGQLSEEQLQSILSAGLQAPSAINAQPWHFTVVQDQALLDRIHAAAAAHALRRDPGARSPRFADPDFHIFYHAPTVVFISAAPSRYAPVDCGIAVENMALAAEAIGLGSVILGMPREAFESGERAELEQALRFPEGHAFVIALALGTPDDQKEPHAVDPGKITYIR